MLQDGDVTLLETYKTIGESWKKRGEYLIQTVEHCFENKSTKGIDEMVAFAFNGAGIDPQYGGGGGGLPAGKHPVQIVDSELKPTSDGKGGYLALTLEAVDGPAKGVRHTDRLNLNNSNPEAVRIANQQLAAYLAVMGLPPAFNDTNELHNKPFVVEIAPQKNEPKYTEVVALFDMNGNKPGAQGGGQPAGAASPPPEQQQQQQGGGNGWGNQPAQQQQQQQQQPQGGEGQAQGGAQSGWQQGQPAGQGGAQPSWGQQQ